MVKTYKFVKHQDYNGTDGWILDKYKDSPFDSIDTHQMFFHDIMEHSHEGDKYFKGDYEYNLMGEIVAMGSLYYYLDRFDISNLRSLNGTYLDKKTCFDQIESQSIDAIKYGYPDEYLLNGLNCNIPYQKPIEDCYFENLIKDFNKKIHESKIEADKEELEDAKLIKKSFTLSKLQRGFRYGYRLANKFCKDTAYNLSSVYEFISNLKQQINNFSDEYYDNIWIENIEFKVSGTGNKRDFKCYVCGLGSDYNEKTDEYTEKYKKQRIF